MVRHLVAARLCERPNSNNPTHTTPIRSVPQCLNYMRGADDSPSVEGCQRMNFVIHAFNNHVKVLHSVTPIDLLARKTFSFLILMSIFIVIYFYCVASIGRMKLG